MNDTTTCCDLASPVAEPPGGAEFYERIARTAKALGHPARVQIMAILLARESCVCGEIVGLLPLAQATVSQHLKVLKDAGLIRGEIDGPRVCYCANADAVMDHRELLDHLVGITGTGAAVAAGGRTA